MFICSQEAGDDYARYCRLCLERAFEKVCIIANDRRQKTQESTHISLAGDTEKIIDSFRVSTRVWNTVCEKQDVLPPIVDLGNPREPRREKGLGNFFVCVRNCCRRGNIAFRSSTGIALMWTGATIARARLEQRARRCEMLRQAFTLC